MTMTDASPVVLFLLTGRHTFRAPPAPAALLALHAWLVGRMCWRGRFGWHRRQMLVHCSVDTSAITPNHHISLCGSHVADGVGVGRVLIAC